jgi:hypothetical protein
VCALSAHAQELNHVNDSIKPLIENPSIIDSEKVCGALTLQIDSLNSELENLRKENKANEAKCRQMENKIQSQQSEIQSKNNSIEKLETSYDKLQRKLVSMASNFLYIPYEQYSIDRIAIPAFELVRNTEYFDKYQNRLDMLKNYRNDVQELIDFLNSIKSEEKNEFSMAFDFMREDVGNNMLEKLKSLNVYNRYQSYNDWTNTYLGREIQNITKELEQSHKEYLNNLDIIQKRLTALLEAQY